MIEHTTGFKIVTSIVVKPLVAALIAFGWWPTADFIIIQVNNYVLLNPETKIVLEECKIILGVLISACVLIRIILGIIYHKKGKK